MGELSYVRCRWGGRGGAELRVVQPRITIIFRGTGTRISKEERKRWHPQCVVMFQKKAWFDRLTVQEWLRRYFKVSHQPHPPPSLLRTPLVTTPIPQLARY